jgi:predicted transcriptional regulator
MTVSDLKLKIFRQIDSLEKDRLEELYGVLVNFINEKKDIADWEKLTEEQQRGIIDAIDEIDLGKGISHQKVMENIRKKYTNA